MKAKLPKLKKSSYRLSAKDFIKLIRNYPPEIRKKFLKRYKAINKALEARKKEGVATGFIAGSKLSDYQKMYVIEMASRFYKPTEILKVIRESWGIKYSNVAINAFLKRNAEEIRQKRARYTSNLENLRYVHERPRIEELTEIVEEAKALKDHNLVIKALAEIRQEVKGDKLTIDNNINANINVNVRNHIINNIDLELFGQLALIKLLEKHNKIDFLKFSHRMTKRIIEKDELTGEVINKEVPVKTEGIGLLKEEEVLSIKQKEEQALSSKEKIKQILKRKLLLENNKMKEFDEQVDGLEVKEEKKKKKKKEKQNEKAK